MKARKYFPLSKAKGQAFCNRVREIKWLQGNIKNAKHSLLIAPRRYGKSSLVEKAIVETKLPFIRINFHLCASEQEVTQLIIANVIKLIGAAVGSVEKLMSSIKNYLSNLKPSLSFGGDVATLELEPKQHVNHAVIIYETLLLIEKLLQKKNKKAVIFFDEFQEIINISKNANVEGAIRTAAQELQNLSIIFSGSIRSLLLSMFEDENRPLYKLCRKLKLDRISAANYKEHINKIAVKTWGGKLDDPVFEKIMHLSNRHAYYVNYLCDIIWEENKQLPSIKQVNNAWSIVVEEEQSDALKEIAQLALSQRKLLKYIANHALKNILKQEVYTSLALPVSTVGSAVEALVEKDYIEITESGYYKIINPMLQTVLIAE